MTIFIRAFAVLLSFALSGLISACTPAQLQANSIVRTIKTASASYKACLAPIEADPTYAPLSVHAPLFMIENSTLEEMASTQTATPTEAALLFKLRDAVRPCDLSEVTSLSSVAPSVAAPFQSYQDSLDEGVLLLSQGKINWGDYVRVSMKNRAAALADSQQALSQIGQKLQQENDIEQAQQAQAQQNFADYQQRQEEINQADLERQQESYQQNRPVTTNCNTFGNQTRCTSY